MSQNKDEAKFDTNYVIHKPIGNGAWEYTGQYRSPKIGEYYSVAIWDKNCPVRECQEGSYFLNFSSVFIMKWKTKYPKTPKNSQPAPNAPKF